MFKNHFLPQTLSALKKQQALPAVFLVILCPLFFLTGCGTRVADEPDIIVTENLDTGELKMTMLTDIASIILSDDDLADDVKSDIAKMAISPLRKSNETEVIGTDAQTRPVAVTFQKAFEQSVLNMMDEKKVTQVTAIIHTRKPTTPLCNPEGDAFPQTMHPDMKGDFRRSQTIKDRTATLREMAKKESLDLYVAYLEDGLQKRSPEEQKEYRKELSNPINRSLHDIPLTCTNMPDEMVGASYVLKTSHGNKLYFGINGKQAIDATGETTWRYWFGNLKAPRINGRYNKVVEYLKNCGMSVDL